MLHFHSVKGKVDLGKKPEEETENEYAYKKLVEQIAKSRLKYLQKLRNESEPMSPSKSKSLFRKSIMILNRRNSATKEKNLIDILSSNITENSENNNKNKIIEKEKKEEKNDIEDNKNNEKDNNEENKKILNLEIVCGTESNKDDNVVEKKGKFPEHKNKKKKKKRKKEKKDKTKYILSEKKFKININNMETNFRTPKISTKKDNKNSLTEGHSKIYPENSSVFNTSNNPINNLKSQKNLKSKKNELSSKIIISENDIYESNSLNENTNNQDSSILNKSNSSSYNHKQFLNELKNLEKIRKNNATVHKKERNPAFWNNNMKRVHTAGFRAISNKVMYKPIYTYKIGDLVKEYNRIKTDSNKSRITMRENNFATMNDIEKYIRVKEDLLMFNLKWKFLQSGYHKKREKPISKEKLLRKKVTNCFEIIDNPLYLESEEN